MCGRHRRHPATEEVDPDADLGNVNSASGDSAPDNSAESGPKFSVVLSALRAPSPGNLLLDPGPVTPVVVYTGPTRTPDEIAKLEAMIAAEPVKKRAKRRTAATKSGDHSGDHDAATPAKPAEHKAGKPAKHKPAAAKLDGNAHAANAAAVPGTPRWTPMSASALAASPPPELKADAPAAAAKPAAAEIRQ